MDLKALYNISYGIYVVSSKKENRINGQIANTVFQTTSEPATIAVCINKENLTHEFITESKVFSVSVLEQETDMKFIGKFGFKSGRDEDKFKGVNYKIGGNRFAHNYGKYFSFYGGRSDYGNGCGHPYSICRESC